MLMFLYSLYIDFVRVLFVVDLMICRSFIFNLTSRVFHNQEENPLRLDYEHPKKGSAARDHEVVPRRFCSYD